MSPVDRGAKRTASVSDRISARFKELRKNLAEKDKHEGDDEKKPLSPNSPVFSTGEAATEEDVPSIPSKDKGKGKQVVPERTDSPTPMSPPLPQLNLPIPESKPTTPNIIILAGLSIPAQTLSALLTRASQEMPLRKVRFPILGEYNDCFSGEEFVEWLKENVEGFGGSLDRAEDAATELTERDGALRRIGELGNRFENSGEAYFQFRPKVNYLVLRASRFSGL